jgi:hypothetical protein
MFAYDRRRWHHYAIQSVHIFLGLAIAALPCAVAFSNVLAHSAPRELGGKYLLGSKGNR